MFDTMEQNLNPVVMLHTDGYLSVTLNRKLNPSQCRAFINEMLRSGAIKHAEPDNLVNRHTDNTVFCLFFKDHTARDYQTYRADIFERATRFMTELPAEMVTLSLF